MNTPQDQSKRKQTFKRNRSLEDLLADLNDSLSYAEDKALQSYSDEYTNHPILFIMGPHRSGTTLLMQWLANSGMIAYPTNLLSRFYNAPVIGAQIQLLLTDPRFNFRNEILDFNSPISFESENGKTKGALAPNEFWYFWRRFLPFQEIDWLPDEELFRVVDQDTLVSELTALTRVFGKPFALKSMIMNYNIPFLASLFPQALFIQTKRDPITNIASILEARKRQLGSEKEWYSFKIPEYPQLINLDPITQSAGQLYYINAAVTKGMATLRDSKKLVVQYEDFCQNPLLVFEKLQTKLDIPENDYSFCGPKKFSKSRSTDVPNRKAIEKALLKFGTG